MTNTTNITVNAGGIPVLQSTNISVGTDSVNIGLGFRNIRPMGNLIVELSDVIPASATTTLPVTLTLNGTTRALTLPNSTPVTVAELTNVSVFAVYNNRFKGLLTLMSRTTD
jgi:hypothetical protein